MHTALFKALKSIGIDDERATDVVNELEAYMKGRMEDVTKPLEGKIEDLSKTINRFAALVALLAAATAFGPAIAKLVH